MQEVKFIRWILTWNLVCGALLLMAGLVMMILPAVQLDVVLTPQELADPIIRRAAQNRLWQQRGNSWIGWCIAGGAIVIPNLTGLIAITIWQSRLYPHLASSPLE